MDKEYIPREDVCLQLEKQESIDGQPRAIRRARRIVAEFPAADVVEVRHGRWVNERQEGLSSVSAECSLCGKRTLAYFHYSYCPNCGAKMDGGQDE